MDARRWTAPAALAATAALVSILALAVVPAGASARQARRYVAARTSADADLPPYSGAVLVGNTLYLAGSLGLEEGNRVPATIEDEARNVMDGIRATLAAFDMTMDDLVSVQVFCADVAYYDRFNRVYRTYFTREYPVRAFLGSGTLLYGARFEVMGIAVKR